MEPDNIISICTAYEQGFGHGYDRRRLKNPYYVDDPTFVAWDYGYLEGNRKRVKHEEQSAHG